MLRDKKRRFSMERDFMTYKTNDLLYAFMRTLSTAMPTDKSGQYKEYLLVSDFSKQKKLIANICNKTTRTIDNNVKKLIECGLIAMELKQITNNRSEYAYTFHFDYDGNYKLLSVDLLNYLINTRNAQSIRIYLYLLNKYQWKKDYVFTTKEIKLALGYSESTNAENAIRQCLESFAREGVIKYTNRTEIVTNPLNPCNTVPRAVMVLNHVISDVAELRVI